MKKNFNFIKKVLAIVFGSLMGLVNGLLGGGGGMFCVPILEKLYGLPTKHAHSTALLVMLPLSVMSSIIYLLSNNMDVFTLSLCGIGVVSGGLIGAIFLKRINSKWIMLAFAILMLAAGIRMVIA